MLVKSTLEQALLAAFNAASDVDKKPADLRAQMARDIATAIDSYIRTAQVNRGIPVATTGTAAAQTGATTGTGMLS